MWYVSACPKCPFLLSYFRLNSSGGNSPNSYAFTSCFNFISVIGGLVGGFIVSLFGGWDVMLYTILLFAILDYFTGILKAVYKKELSSAIGFKGIVKKIMVFVVIAVAYNVQRMTGDTIPLREIVIVFFICNEALSILENAAEFINIPQQLKDVLLQLRDKNAAKAEEKEESEE